MGLLSGLGGLMAGQGGDAMSMGLLPMLMQQQKKPDQQPSFLQNGMQNLGNDPMFANNMSMMTTGQPQMSGMGPLSNAEAGGMQGAFGNNPHFMQQLQALQNGQGPGRQPPQFTPPPTQMNTAVPQQGNGQMRGMSGQNNFGMNIGDPMQQFFMARMGRPQG